MNESWMEEFEQRLLQLETVAHSSSDDLDTVVQSADRAIECLWSKVETSFWLLDSTQTLRFAAGGFQIQSSDIDAKIRELPNESVLWGSTSEWPLFAQEQFAEADLLFIRRHSLSDFGYLIVASSGDTTRCSKDQVDEATSAASTLLTFQVAQHLLAATSTAARRQEQLLNFASKLQTCQNQADVHQVVAQENGLCWPNTRITSLDFDGKHHTAKAITAVGQVNNQSAQVKLIELLADHLLQDLPNESNAHLVEGVRVSVDELEDRIVDSILKDEFRQLVTDFRTADVQQVLAVPIKCDDQHVTSVLIESYGAVPTVQEPLADWRQQIQAATFRCGRESRSGRTGFQLSRRAVFAGIAAMMAISFLIPMEFELPVSGQLVAQGRRSLFAPESGTVTTVHFTNEKRVAAGEKLLELSSPELSLRLSELDGEIATTEAAVAAANARRINRTADGSAAEGQILKQRLKSLKSERLLTQQRIESLEIKAPFEGVIVRRDAEQNLTNRPLQRGQRIAELIPDGSGWELELYIPQSHYSYLQIAKKDGGGELGVRYVMNSESDTTYQSTIQSIEQLTYSRHSILVQNAKASVELPDSSNARSGTSVSARIACGTRSVGFVATRKVIEILQYLKFVWWN